MRRCEIYPMVNGYTIGRAGMRTRKCTPFTETTGVSFGSTGLGKSQKLGGFGALMSRDGTWKSREMRKNITN